MMTSTSQLHNDQQTMGKTMTGLTQCFVRNHRFIINPDSVLIKGCRYIYARRRPGGRVRAPRR
jgi:hypothetical protein